MTPALLLAAMVIFPHSSPMSRNSFPYKLKCHQVVDQFETYLECERFDPDAPKPSGPRPVYHCSFTAYSHVQRGICTDGKGSFKTDLRGSGPHPRQAVKP